MDKIDGKMFRNMILSGAENLRQHAEYVDSLNVFPVPDGDTGTNMNLSMTSGANEVEGREDAHIGTVGRHFSKGLLMGARGNSASYSPSFSGASPKRLKSGRISMLKISPPHSMPE